MRSRTMIAVVVAALVACLEAPAMADVPILMTAGSTRQVFKVWPSGKKARLTDSPGDKGLAVWSKDHDMIAYSVNPRRGGTVRVMRADGSRDRKVFPYIAKSLAWSPDGRYLLVEHRDEIFRVTVSDGHFRKLIDGTSMRRFSSPAWVPGTNKIVFVRSDFSEGDTDLMVMNEEGRAVDQLHGADVLPYPAPSFSPSGDRFVFAGRSENGTDLFTLGKNGGKLRQVTDSEWDEQAPTWGPKDRIAFLNGPHNENRDRRVCTTHPSGRSVRCSHEVLSFVFWGTQRRIAYTAAQAGSADGIYIARTDGTRRRIVKRGLVADW